MSFVFGICLALIILNEFIVFIYYYSCPICCITVELEGLTYAEVRITNQKELMDVGFNSALNCISQLDINIDTCSELLDDTFNSSDIKYDRCKCFIPCVSKLIGTMDVSEGKWDEKRYKEITALIEIPEWKQEAEVIGKYCKDNINTHCSAGFRLIQCALKHSTMLQNIAKNYMIQKQAEIEAINSATFNDTEDD